MIWQLWLILAYPLLVLLVAALVGYGDAEPPSAPLDDLMERRETLSRMATERGDTAQRGERRRSSTTFAEQLVDDFDPRFYDRTDVGHRG